MCRSPALHMKYVPLRQVPTHHSHSASLVSRMDFSSQTPAELTRMSRPPKRSTVSATRRSQSATAETSPSTTACSRSCPCSRERAAARAATACVFAASRPPTATLTPSSARR